MIGQNPYITFYKKFNISPVHQDISDMKRHLLRREKLFRKLGLPVLAFNGREILEVGPGGGYNSLAFFYWGAKKVDFVEPNPKAQEEIPVLLNKYGIEKSLWTIYGGMIEEYNVDKKYDIVIAEGFIPHIPNQRDVVDKLSLLVKDGGALIVTCSDDVSIFFDYLKRIVGKKLIAGINNFQDKINMLSKAFETHLKSLKFASRPIEDWVADNILNPAYDVESIYSIADFIEQLDHEFYYLGSSPSMFTDYSWYKDIEFDFNKDALRQFNEKRHMFMLWDLPESKTTEIENTRLVDAAAEFRRFTIRMNDFFSEDNKRR